MRRTMFLAVTFVVASTVLSLWALPSVASASVFNFTTLMPAYSPTNDQEALSVVTGDFNHDGKVDVAFDNGFNDGTTVGCPAEGCVSVLLGNGDATFTGPVNYSTGGTPAEETASLATGDLNGDGNPDLVVANATGFVAILYGNGDGTFQAPVDVYDDPRPNVVVVGDFNGDGHEDIAVADEVDETVAVLLNTVNDAAGHARFAPAPGSPFSLDLSSNGPIDGMTTANLSGHGKVDLVLSTSPVPEGSGTCGSSDCVQVLLNAGDHTGSFKSVVVYGVTGGGQVAAADLRGTGVDDVLVPADVQGGVPGTGGFELLHNDGTGALGPPSFFTYPGSANPQALAVGDFNNDGKLDMAMADFTSSITVLFEGNGDGTFTYDSTVPDPLGLQGSDNALAAADFNGDCKPDLVAGTFDGGLVVMRNDTPPAGSACPTPPPPAPGPPSPSTTPTTPPTVVVPPAPPKKPPTGKPKRRTHVTQRISITGAPTGCTTSAVLLRIRIEISPREVASRRTAHGALTVRVVTIVRLDGQRIAVSRRRAFAVMLPLSRLAVGSHRLTFTTTTSGAAIRGSRKVRTVRFSRCAPLPLFTG